MQAAKLKLMIIGATVGMLLINPLLVPLINAQPQPSSAQGLNSKEAALSLLKTFNSNNAKIQATLSAQAKQLQSKLQQQRDTINQLAPNILSLAMQIQQITKAGITPENLSKYQALMSAYTSLSSQIQNVQNTAGQEFLDLYNQFKALQSAVQSLTKSNIGTSQMAAMQNLSIQLQQLEPLMSEAASQYTGLPNNYQTIQDFLAVEQQVLEITTQVDSLLSAPITSDKMQLLNQLVDKLKTLQPQYDGLLAQVNDIINSSRPKIGTIPGIDFALWQGDGAALAIVITAIVVVLTAV